MNNSPLLNLEKESKMPFCALPAFIRLAVTHQQDQVPAQHPLTEHNRCTRKRTGVNLVLPAICRQGLHDLLWQVPAIFSYCCQGQPDHVKLIGTKSFKFRRPTVCSIPPQREVFWHNLIIIDDWQEKLLWLATQDQANSSIPHCRSLSSCQLTAFVSSLRVAASITHVVRLSVFLSAATLWVFCFLSVKFMLNAYEVVVSANNHMNQYILAAHLDILWLRTGNTIITNDKHTHTHFWGGSFTRYFLLLFCQCFFFFGGGGGGFFKFRSTGVRGITYGIRSVLPYYIGWFLLEFLVTIVFIQSTPESRMDYSPTPPPPPNTINTANEGRFRLNVYSPYGERTQSAVLTRTPPRRPARPRQDFIFNLSMRESKASRSSSSPCGGRRHFRLGVSSSVGHCCQHFWAGWGPNRIKGGLRHGKCQRDKQALQIFLGWLQLDDRDGWCCVQGFQNSTSLLPSCGKSLFWMCTKRRTCHLDKHGRRWM